MFLVSERLFRGPLRVGCSDRETVQQGDRIKGDDGGSQQADGNDWACQGEG